MSNEPTGVRVLMLTVLMLMLLLCSLSSITFPAKKLHVERNSNGDLQ